VLKLTGSLRAGWYVSSSATTTGNINLFSGLGISQIMSYGLNQNPAIMHNTTAQLAYLDAAHAAGVKVLWPMQEFGWTGNPSCDPLSPSW